MKFIIGLGNPGKKYSTTRHNIGFAVLDSFAEHKLLKWKKYKDCAEISMHNDFLVIKPTLFMNRSGMAIIPLIKKYLSCSRTDSPDFEELIVISDDMDISFGRIQIKKNGSSCGHNGVESIIETLGTNKFCRMRIGIGRPPLDVDPVDFVLSDFTEEETTKMKPVILRATDAACVFIESGLQKTMNLFNGKYE
ncbi:MAG: aminoacyl-tRNA hydrolase [Elusimicrobiota bacterium]